MLFAAHRNRSSQIIGETNGSGNSLLRRQLLPFSEVHRSVDLKEHEDTNSLIDMLFQTIGRYEAMETKLNLEKQKVIRLAQSDSPIFSVFHIPTDEIERKTENVFLQSDEWQKISIPVSYPELLRKLPLRFFSPEHQRHRSDFRH